MKHALVAGSIACLLISFETAAQRRLPNGTRIKPKPVTQNTPSPAAPKQSSNSATPAPTGTPAAGGQAAPGKPDAPSQISLAVQGENSVEGEIKFKTLVPPEKKPGPPSCKNLPDAHDWLERADRAATILRELMDATDRTMPQAMLNRANCVAVVPSMKKGGISLGGQWGRGVMSCRYDNRAWSPPVFFTLTGGSFGLQLGFQFTDLLMIISDRSGADALLRDKVEIGAGAGGSLLLLGRNAGVSSNVLMDSRVFSYARSRGLYGGLELRGSYLRPDVAAHRIIYGETVHVHDILSSEKIGSELNTFCYSGIGAFSRALRDVSPAKVYYAKVPRPRYQQAPPPSAPAK